MTKLKSLFICSSMIVLSACATPPYLDRHHDLATHWTSVSSVTPEAQADIFDVATPNADYKASLEKWWMDFNDPTLTALVDMAIAHSPTRAIAQANIMEARGIARSTRSSLFPSIGVNASAGRQDTGSNFASTNPDNFYDASFDASYEIDLFGVNRNTSEATNLVLSAREAELDAATLTLIGDVVRAYVQYLGFQDQRAIAQDNLRIQEETLELITLLVDVGENTSLDLESARAQVNTTRAQIPEFERLATNAQLQLTALTGALPSDIKEIMVTDNNALPGFDIKPVLLAPSDIIATRPDIKTAMLNLEASTALRRAAFGDLFPDLSITGLFGITDGGFASNANIWSVALGTAYNLLDFGRLEGQLDAAEAVEARSFAQYRQTVLNAVTEVETALNDYAKIDAQRQALQGAYDNARNALELSMLLFKEGEIDFLDVLDAQAVANNAESALSTAYTNQIQALVRLYKSLGVY